MNGGKAKRLRRDAYGDLSLKTPRKYTRVTVQKATEKPGYFVNRDTLWNHPDSPRARYQALKVAR